MKRCLLLLAAFAVPLMLSACASQPPAAPVQAAESLEATGSPLLQTTAKDGENKILLSIGEQSFSGTLADTEAAHEFARLLPMTLQMSELNGNEKYVYLDGNLSAAASRPERINTGDLMLYGSVCVVLFYDDFISEYSYTSIGKIDDPDGLAAALGDGSVTVAFTTD